MLSPKPDGIPGRWKLVLNAGFTGRSFDDSVWRAGWFGTGVTGPINKHELACYRSSNVVSTQHEAVRLEVTADRSRCKGRARRFTGALLSTNPKDGRARGGFRYRYGVVEARVYLPGVGSKIADWPSVMTLGQVWPRDGEDDVMENLGGTVCFHFHSPGHAPGGNLGACDPGVTPGWHTVASDWEPHSVTWYYDGIEVGHVIKGITSAPMYIVLVDTVSSKSLGVIRPAAMRVAYVRVWRRLP